MTLSTAGTLRPLALVLLVLACAEERLGTEPEPGDPPESGAVVRNDVRYTARSEILPGAADSLRITAIAVNRGSEAAHLEWGACSLFILLDSASGREDPPAWDERDHSEIVCPLYLALADPAPGDTVAPREWRRSVSVAEILGEGFSTGRTRVTALLYVNDDTLRVSAGSVELAP